MKSITRGLRGYEHAVLFGTKIGSRRVARLRRLVHTCLPVCRCPRWSVCRTRGKIPSRSAARGNSFQHRPPRTRPRDSRCSAPASWHLPSRRRKPPALGVRVERDDAGDETRRERGREKACTCACVWVCETITLLESPITPPNLPYDTQVIPDVPKPRILPTGRFEDDSSPRQKISSGGLARNRVLSVFIARLRSWFLNWIYESPATTWMIWYHLFPKLRICELIDSSLSSRKNRLQVKTSTRQKTTSAGNGTPHA